MPLREMTATSLRLPPGPSAGWNFTLRLTRATVALAELACAAVRSAIRWLTPWRPSSEICIVVPGGSLECTERASVAADPVTLACTAAAIGASAWLIAAIGDEFGFAVIV